MSHPTIASPWACGSMCATLLRLRGYRPSRQGVRHFAPVCVAAATMMFLLFSLVGVFGVLVSHHIESWYPITSSPGTASHRVLVPHHIESCLGCARALLSLALPRSRLQIAHDYRLHAWTGIPARSPHRWRCADPARRQGCARQGCALLGRRCHHPRAPVDCPPCSAAHIGWLHLCCGGHNYIGHNCIGWRDPSLLRRP